MIDNAQVADSDDLQMMILENLQDQDDDALMKIFVIMFPETPITVLENGTFKIDWAEEVE